MKTFALKWITVPLKKFKIFIKCTREKNFIDNLFLLLQHMGFKKMLLKNFMTGNTAIMNVNKIMNQIGAQITKNKHKRKRNRNYWQIWEIVGVRNVRCWHKLPLQKELEIENSQISIEYSLKARDQQISVCKKMFLHTLDRWMNRFELDQEKEVWKCS